MKKRILAILVAAAVAFGMIPQFALPVLAKEKSSDAGKQGAPKLSVGTDVLKTNAGLDGAQELVYFGKAWNVIAYDGRDGNGNLLRYQNKSGAWENLYSSKAVTVLMKGDAGVRDLRWGNTSEWILNDYSTSLLISYINHGFYSNLYGNFAAQKSAILPRTLKGDGGLLGTNDFDANAVRGATVYDAAFWPLSEAEARLLPQSLMKADQHWWLRTPGPLETNPKYDPNGLVAFVFLHRDRDYEIDYGSVDAPSESGGMLRPAFDLNEDAVCFTSMLYGYEGKDSGDLGPDAMKPVGTTTGDKWCLTLKDDGTIPGLDGHASFKVTSSSKTDTGVQVNYTGATTGGDEYISAIIQDRTTGEILSYGRISKAQSADGSITINLPANRSCNEQLYVFNEHFEMYGGDTDYASKLYPIEREDAVHTWDGGKVTKAPTATEEGIKTFTCKVCKTTRTEKIPKLTISGTLFAQAKTKGKTSLAFSWSKIEGAEGYDIFFAPCNKADDKTKYKLAKTIKGNKTFKWTKKGLKKNTAYKFEVKAFVKQNGKKKYVRNSPALHIFTSGYSGKYTNAKSVTVNKTKVTLAKGKTFKIKAVVNKVYKKRKLMPTSHAPLLRFLSTNDKVATVSSSGKIKAKGKGTCKIYVFAHNGVAKTVKVTVK